MGCRGARSSAGTRNDTIKWSRTKKISVNTAEGKKKMPGITSGDYTIIQNGDSYQVYKELTGANRPIEVGRVSSFEEGKKFVDIWENPTMKWEDLREPRNAKGIKPEIKSGKYTINDEGEAYVIYENGKKIGSSSSSLNELKGLIEVYEKMGKTVLNGKSRKAWG